MGNQAIELSGYQAIGHLASGYQAIKSLVIRSL